MKKAAKSKAKKPAAKKAKKAPKAKKMIAKAKKPAKSIAKPKAKSKSKGMSVTDLFLLKKAKEQAVSHDDPHVHEAPPHELHDKADLQPKPQGNTKLARGPGPGNRHH